MEVIDFKTFCKNEFRAVESEKKEVELKIIRYAFIFAVILFFPQFLALAVEVLKVSLELNTPLAPIDNIQPTIF